MNYRKAFVLFFVIVLIFFLLFFTSQYSNVIKFIERILVAILSHKEESQVQFLTLMVLLNLFYFLSPLPVFPLIIFNGFVFGLFGFVFSMFFIILCSILIFYFSRIYLKKDFSEIIYFKYIKKKIKKYKFINKPNFYSIFISRYIIPYFFHNIFFGLTNLTVKNFFLIILLAEIPLTLATNSIGKSLNNFVLIENYKIFELFLNYEFTIPFVLIVLIILMSGSLRKGISKVR